MENNKNISEELNKIKSLIEAKHSELILEQDDALRAMANKIQGDIRRATSGPMTNEDLLLATIQQINSLQLYNAVNGLIKQKPIDGSSSILQILNAELGNGDVKVATQIKQALAKIGKNITFQGNTLDIVPNSFKIVSTVSTPVTAPASVNPKTKQPVSATPVKKKSNLGPRFAKTTQSLGIQNAKMDVATLQKILASLEGGAPKAKTAADYLPKEIEAPSQEELNAQLPPNDNQ